ncbi:cysteine peptidase family C39 domain-containing protein [Porphyromonas loveana]
MNEEKKSFSFLAQTDAMDCGPACLAMIAEHYSLRFDRDYLRNICSFGKDGVSLLGISNASEKIGFKAVGGRLNFDTLLTEATLPCIIHWEQNHFVVFYKLKKHNKGRYTFYIADPARGLLTYDKEEFCNHWISTKTFGKELKIVRLIFF